MAEQNIPSFAVDSDITPLQGRYFQYAKTGITDPRVRAQAYGLIKQTFGGIQQARDIQRAKQQEDEQRALQMDMNRAQLDKYKLDLLNARDEYRRKQDSAAINANFYGELDAIKNDTTISPSEKAARMLETGARYSSSVTEDPVAQNRFKLMVDAVKAENVKPKASQDPLTVLDKYSKALKEGGDPESLAGFVSPEIAGSAAFQGIYQKAQEDKAKKAAEETKKAVEDLEDKYEESLKLLKGAGVFIKGRPDKKGNYGPGQSEIKPEEVDWVGVDNLLKDLDAIGLVDEKDKKDLVNAGVRAFEQEAMLPEELKGATQLNPKTYTERNRKALRTIDNIIRKGKTLKAGTVAPAAKPGAFNPAALAE